MFLLNNTPTPLQLGDRIEFDFHVGSFQIRRGTVTLDMLLGNIHTGTFEWNMLKDRFEALRLGGLMADCAGYGIRIVHDTDTTKAILELVSL